MARAKGKKAHRARVAKRNNKIANQKYAYDKAVKNYMAEIQKQMQERAEAAANEESTGSIADGIVEAANASTPVTGDDIQDAVVVEDEPTKES